MMGRMLSHADEEAFYRFAATESGCALIGGALAQRFGASAWLGAVVGALAGAAIWWTTWRAERRAG